jgi:hypothetical protein
VFSPIYYLEKVFKRGQITFRQFCARGDKTVPVMIKLHRAWGLRIGDTRQYRQV